MASESRSNVPASTSAGTAGRTPRPSRRTSARRRARQSATASSTHSQQPAVGRRDGRLGGHPDPTRTRAAATASPPDIAPLGRTDSPGSRRGTSTRRLNSATSTPSWLRTRVCTLTVPRSGLDFDSRTSSTSVSQNSVSPWKTGRRVLELLGSEVGDRLARHVGDAHAERERVDERADDDVAALLRLRRVDVVDVQRVVVHRDQAEQVVVRLGDGLGRPVLVDGADLELLEVAAVRVGAARLAGGLVGLDAASRVGARMPSLSRPGEGRFVAITSSAVMRRGAGRRDSATGEIDLPYRVELRAREPERHASTPRRTALATPASRRRGALRTERREQCARRRRQQRGVGLPVILRASEASTSGCAAPAAADRRAPAPRQRRTSAPSPGPDGPRRADAPPRRPRSRTSA